MDITSKDIYLAVLPLQVLSDDPKADMFCQALVMDLITDLSRFRSFGIIAYETIKTLPPNETTGSPQLDALQIDYLIKGLARQHQDRLHLNIQLINIRENRIVWAEKYSDGLEHWFQIQEDIVEKIVVSLQHFVDDDLLKEMKWKSATHFNAYECWLRGYRELQRGTLEADERARRFFHQAMDIDPAYPRAYTGMSLSYFNEWSCQLWNRWEISQSGAFEWAQKALERDEWDHVSNAILGRLYLFMGDWENAEHYLRKALRINPNDADTLLLTATSFCFLGYAEEANTLYQRAQRLNPADERHYLSAGAFIEFERGHFEEAIALAERHPGWKGWVDFPAFQAAAYFRVGDQENMKRCWQAYLHEFSQKINDGQPADSQTALQWMINMNPYRGATQLQPFWEFMSQTDVESLSLQPPTEPTQAFHHFVREGAGWRVAYHGKVVQLPDLKGCNDLNKLLRRPNHPLHCTELMGVEVLEKGMPVIDEQAKESYRKRILELQEAIGEAEAMLQSERLTALREEYEQLIDQLGKAIGKGGKIRQKGGTVEKCRTAVTWRIRSAIKKIAALHPALGKHLEVSVKTGVFCEYAPEQELTWAVE